MKQFQELLMSISYEDTDEEVGSKVKNAVKKIKKGAHKKNSTENIRNDSCQNELEQEINISQKNGLQSPPNKKV